MKELKQYYRQIKRWLPCGGSLKKQLMSTIVATIEEYRIEYPDADYVILEGGSNDADLLGNAFLGSEKTRLGTFEKGDYSGDYDRSTFTGALESVFYRATKYWMGKKIGFIIAHKMKENSADMDVFYNRRVYFDRAAEICEKWGIPYIDLWKTYYLNPFLPWMFDKTKSKEELNSENVCFYVDGQHLSSRGYDVTADIINSWIEKL